MSRKRNYKPQTGNTALSAIEEEILTRRTKYFIKWRNYITRLCLSRIKWNGLPETIRESYIEQILLYKGSILFFQLDGIPVAAEYTAKEGEMNIYGEPQEFQAIFPNGTIVDVPEGEGIIVYDNKLHFSVFDDIIIRADDIAEVEITMNSNITQQRSFITITGPEQALKDKRSIERALYTAKPIIIKNDIAAEVMQQSARVESNPINIPFKADKLNSHKDALLSDILLSLGIVNVPRDKSQYMNYEETGMTNDAVGRIRDDLIDSRQESLDLINELWGTEINVEWRNDSLLPFSSNNNEELEENE